MTYKTLMKKVDEGRIEVMAWQGTGCYGTQNVDVLSYPSNLNKRPTRKVLTITGRPEDDIGSVERGEQQSFDELPEDLRD